MRTVVWVQPSELQIGDHILQGVTLMATEVVQLGKNDVGYTVVSTQPVYSLPVPVMPDPWTRPVVEPQLVARKVAQ
jgi:hypothetical protein